MFRTLLVFRFLRFFAAPLLRRDCCGSFREEVSGKKEEEGRERRRRGRVRERILFVVSSLFSSHPFHIASTAQLGIVLISSASWRLEIHFFHATTSSVWRRIMVFRECWFALLAARFFSHITPWCEEASTRVGLSVMMWQMKKFVRSLECLALC